MTCVICKKGEPRAGKATVTLERGGKIMVVRGVPALVCPNCGEEYVDEAVARKLLEAAEEEARSGTQVSVREYASA